MAAGFFGNLVCAVLILMIVDANIRAGLGQRYGDTRSYPRTSARHKGCLALEDTLDSTLW